MRPSFKYIIFILGMAFAIFGVIFASVIGSWLNLTQEEQSLLLNITDKIIPFPIMGAFTLFFIIGGLVSLLFKYYIIPIMKIAESTQLITLANPNHRIPLSGAREVLHLAQIINSSAEAYQKLKHDVEAAIYDARADLLEERNRFAALMSELPTGVLVSNIHGQILLYNKQAQLVLQPTETGVLNSPIAQSGLLGLGRSLFTLIPRDKVTEGIEIIKYRIDAGESDINTSLKVNLEGHRTLNISMAPVFSFHCEQHDECMQCDRRKISGLVLLLDDDKKQVDNHSGRIQKDQPTSSLDDAHNNCSFRPSEVRRGLIPASEPRPFFYEFDLFNHLNFDEAGEQSLRRLTYVAFDTETTGLEPSNGDEIIQLGAVRIVSGRIIPEEMIDQLVDPKRSIPESSVLIHGITSKMVANQPTIEQILPHFHRFAEGAVLVAHNAAFDMRCLQLKEAKAGVKFDNPVLDTLLLSSILHPNQESHTLDEIAGRLNLTNIGRHTALGDALVTAEVLLKMIPLLEAMGIVTLKDALKASTRSPYAKVSY